MKIIWIIGIILILAGPEIARADKAPSFRVGPALVLNIPHPQAELDLVLFDRVSLAAAYGYIPPVSIGNAKVSLRASDAKFRFHVFGGSFFLALAAGQQILSASTSSSVPVGSERVPMDLTIQVTSIYLTPHLGWMFMFDSGFVLGFDFGAQIPVSSSSSMSVASSDSRGQAILDVVKQTPEYQKTERDVTASGDQLGRTPLPFLTVLRFGWMI